MPSIEEVVLCEPKNKQALLDLAKCSIQQGLINGKALKPDHDDFSKELSLPAATFVTLHKFGELRGCIGTLTAYQPLIDDVADHAFSAAFRDSRFSPLTANEFTDLEIEVSILTPSETIECSSEEDLLAQLSPGEDGVTLEFGHYRSTFLPQVWEQLPSPEQFLQQLKRKAGLSSSWWDQTAIFSRYQCIKIS